jgi:anti-anti-sigma regulatory factor
MRFELAARGSVFSTRDRGISLLAELDRLLAAEPDQSQELILDFRGVEHISDSFADEFVANVIRRARRGDRPEPQLENVSESVRRVIARSLPDHDLQCV